MNKTVMKVMMIGLVTMLGAKAEAHYIMVAGKLKWHSLDCVVKLDLKELPDPKSNPAEVECVAKVDRLEIRCPDGAVVKSKVPVTLVARVPIDKIDKEGNVTVFISDDPLRDPKFCGGDPNVIPDVLIRRTSVRIQAYECRGSDPDLVFEPCLTCSSKLLASTFKAENCTLPRAFNFENFPPTGTDYVCEETKIKHDN